MPLIKIDLIAGRSQAETSNVLNCIHQAVVDAFDVPATDRYQCVTQHEPHELIIHDTDLGYARSAKIVLLTIITRRRDPPQKLKFYQLCASYLENECGISPEDLVVSMVENDDEDWSFGMGQAQFITGLLK